jgi:hypothetical protein
MGERIDPTYFYKKETNPDFSKEDWLDGLRTIQEIDPLLEKIIWQEWLRVRVSSFIKPRQVYSDAEEGPADLSGIEATAIKRIAKERATIKQRKAEWRRQGQGSDPNKEYADFTEHIAVIFGSQLHYLGTETTVRQTDEIDDIMRSTDLSGHFKAYIDGRIIQQSAGFDTGDSALFASQKITNAIRFINYGVLGQLLVAESTSEETGREMRGQQDLVPHFVLVISHKRAAEMAHLIKDALSSGDWDSIAAHPLQLEMLEQALAQAKAYRAYAENIAYANKDYARSPVAKLGVRIVRDTRMRKKVLGIFDRCILLFEHALKERRLVLAHQKLRGSDVVKKQLENYQPDAEHLKFLKLFKKEGASQFARFRALLTVMPPVRWDEAAGKKIPIKVRVNGREETLKPRFQSLVGVTHKGVDSKKAAPDV